MQSNLKRYNDLVGNLDAVYDEASKRLGAPGSVMHILYTIQFFGDGCPQSEVYKLFGVSRQTVNSAIHKLSKEGYLSLKPGKGRSTLMYLTENGKALAEKTAGKLIAIENAVFEGWDKAQVESYLALTEKYLNDLKKAVKELPERSE